MWEAFLLAKTLQARPSDLYGIHDEVAAFCFDRAVATFGLSLESELESAEGKTKKAIEAKQGRILAKWLGHKPKFRDPIAMKE